MLARGRLVVSLAETTTLWCFLRVNYNYSYRDDRPKQSPLYPLGIIRLVTFSLGSLVGQMDSDDHSVSATQEHS